MNDEQQKAVEELRHVWTDAVFVATQGHGPLTIVRSEAFRIDKAVEAVIALLEQSRSYQLQREVQLRKALDDLAAEKALRATAELMPGAWRCPKCSFVLQKNILHTIDGAISANTSPLNEVCPNDGQLMKPLTWREANEEFYATHIKLQEDLKAEKALREQAQAELRSIDAVLARRPALSDLEHRIDKVSRACAIAGTAEQAQRERNEALAAMSADTAAVVLAKCVAESQCDELQAKLLAEQAAGERMREALSGIFVLAKSGHGNNMTLKQALSQPEFRKAREALKTK